MVCRGRFTTPVSSFADSGDPSAFKIRAFTYSLLLFKSMYSAPEPDTTISMGVSDTPMLEIGLASVKYTFSTATWFVGDAKRESSIG